MISLSYCILKCLLCFCAPARSSSSPPWTTPCCTDRAVHSETAGTSARTHRVQPARLWMRRGGRVSARSAIISVTTVLSGPKLLSNTSRNKNLRQPWQSCFRSIASLCRVAPFQVEIAHFCAFFRQMQLQRSGQKFWPRL